MTKIFTSHIKKGGGGKTSFTANFIGFCAKVLNKRVLGIDGDNSCNLSYTFGEHKGKNIYDLFKDGTVDIVSVSKNVDMIFGSELLTDDILDLGSRENNKLQLFMWLADNPQILEDYDYIIIDTHNDESLVTSNFIAVADFVISPCDPSKNSWRAWVAEKAFVNDLKARVVDPITRESYINAVPYLIGNKIEVFGNSMPGTSKGLVEVAESEENLLGFIPKKELIAKSLLIDKDIYEQWEDMSVKEKERHQAFYKSINELFYKISEL